MELSMLEFALLGGGLIVATDALVFLLVRRYRARQAKATGNEHRCEVGNV